MIIELISKGRCHSIKCCGANEHISLSTRTFVSLAPPTERQKIFAANFLVLFKKLFCRDFIFSFQHFLFRNENSFCFKESERDMFLSQQKKDEPLVCLTSFLRCEANQLKSSSEGQSFEKINFTIERHELCNKSGSKNELECKKAHLQKCR